MSFELTNLLILYYFSLNTEDLRRPDKNNTDWTQKKIIKYKICPVHTGSLATLSIQSGTRIEQRKKERTINLVRINQYIIVYKLKVVFKVEIFTTTYCIYKKMKL